MRKNMRICISNGRVLTFVSAAVFVFLYNILARCVPLLCIVHGRKALYFADMLINLYGFQYQLSFNAGQKGSILEYFRPSLSYHLSLRSLYGLF